MKNFKFIFPLFLMTLVVFTSCNNYEEEPEIINSSLFDISGIDQSVLFDKSDLKELIINKLLSYESDELNYSDLTNSIQLDEIKVIKSNTGIFVIAEWIDKQNESIGFASTISKDNDDVVLLGECTSRGCSCTIKYCSCLAETGSCTRTWDPPTEEEIN